MSSFDLSTLPPATVAETLSFEAIYALAIARLQEKWADAREVDPTLPAYDVDVLESDPVAVVLQSASAGEMALRAHINDAVRSTLLYYARAGNLDHVGAAHGVTRLPGEQDERYAERIVLKNMDRNSAGSEPRYRYLALTADLRVKDAVVYTAGRDPTIFVALQSTDNDGVADQALIDAVTAAVTAPAVRMVNDTILVEPAVRTVITVAADVWLMPDAPLDATLSDAAQALTTAWAAEGRVGRDLSPSWIVRHLHVAGIHHLNLTAPSAIIEVPFNEIVAIGGVNLTFKGRSY